jgi:hypothetical protein
MIKAKGEQLHRSFDLWQSYKEMRIIVGTAVQYHRA